MEIAAVTKAVFPKAVEEAQPAKPSPAQQNESQSVIPVSVHSAHVNGQTEGVQVSEIGGTYIAEVAGPPAITTSGASLTSAEDKLAYIVNLFA